MNFEELLDKMVKQEGFTFGDPWRFKEKSLAIVVPIIRSRMIPGTYLTTQKPRNYYVIEEVKDKVEFVDTGSIGAVKAKSKADKPVFVRGGSQFGVKRGGMGTQERSVTFGTVLFPEKMEVLKTVCIHASKSISPGAYFSYTGLAPSSVFSAGLYNANQHATWSAISGYARSMVNMLRSRGVGHEMLAQVQTSDDLVGLQSQVERVEEFKQEVEDLLSRIPADLDGQVGIVVFDLNGIVGVEMFSHEESWRAFSESIVRSYSEVLLKEKKLTDIFEFRKDRVTQHITEFLKQLKQTEEKVVWRKRKAETVQMEKDDYVGEYTTLNGDVIHLIVTRKNVSFQQPQTHEFQYTFHETRQPEHRDVTPRYVTSYYTSSVKPERLESFFKRKGSVKFLKTLREPKTWKDLERNVNVSSRTLSKLTKNAANLGLVEKKLRGNGRVVYHLTDFGDKVKRKMALKS